MTDAVPELLELCKQVDVTSLPAYAAKVSLSIGNRV